MTHKILIADDEPNIVISLEYLLQREGYAVLVARDGQEALDTIARERPALVLLDVMMPGTLNGLDVCRRIKSAPGMRHTKVIMLTARVQAGDRAAGFAAGADDYLMKPFSTLQVLETIYRMEAAQ